MQLNFPNNICQEITLDKVYPGARFTSLGDYNIPIDEENESYSLTRFVIVEKFHSPERIGQKFHEYIDDSIAFIKNADIILSITRIELEGEFKITLQKNKNI